MDENTHAKAFDAYDQAGAAANAINCMKYMVLCKVLNDSSDEVNALLSGKMGMKHWGADLEAMAAIAKAAKGRSLDDFQVAVRLPCACCAAYDVGRECVCFTYSLIYTFRTIFILVDVLVYAGEEV